jgi:hypothetical protein
MAKLDAKSTKLPAKFDLLGHPNGRERSAGTQTFDQRSNSYRTATGVWNLKQRESLSSWILKNNLLF